LFWRLILKQPLELLYEYKADEAVNGSGADEMFAVSTAQKLTNVKETNQA